MSYRKLVVRYGGVSYYVHQCDSLHPIFSIKKGGEIVVITEKGKTWKVLTLSKIDPKILEFITGEIDRCILKADN